MGVAERELWLGDVHERAEDHDVLVFIGHEALEDAGAGEQGLHLPHAKVVVVLRGELLVAKL